MDPRLTPTKLIGAIGVIGFLVPALGSVFLAPTWYFPATDSGAAAFAAHLAEHGQSLRVGVLLDAVGVTLWGVFGVGVWVLLRQATGGDSFLSACLLFGVISMATLLMAGFTVFLVLTYRAQAIQDPRLAYDLAFGLLAMSGLPTTVALASYAALTLRSGLMPKSTAIIAILAVVVHLLLPTSYFAPRGFLSMEGQIVTVAPAPLFAWVLVTGLGLLRGYRRLTVDPEHERP